MRIERYACFAVIALAAAALLAGDAGDAASAFKSADDGILRLHVIANSDSFEDQAVKYEVRDAVLKCESEMAGAASAEDAESMLASSGGELLAAVEDTLEANGADYGAELRIGNYDFPERDYAGKVYPEGEYRALRVVLGEGEGKNWWCVMFPPLCMIELKPEENEDDDGKTEGDRKFESLIAEIIKESKNDK